MWSSGLTRDQERYYERENAARTREELESLKKEAEALRVKASGLTEELTPRERGMMDRRFGVSMYCPPSQYNDVQQQPGLEWLDGWCTQNRDIENEDQRRNPLTVWLADIVPIDHSFRLTDIVVPIKHYDRYEHGTDRVVFRRWVFRTTEGRWVAYDGSGRSPKVDYIDCDRYGDAPKANLFGSEEDAWHRARCGYFRLLRYAAMIRDKGGWCALAPEVRRKIDEMKIGVGGWFQDAQCLDCQISFFKAACHHIKKQMIEKGYIEDDSKYVMNPFPY